MFKLQIHRETAKVKVSLNKLLRSLNDEVQVDVMWIKELTEQPILHMKDRVTRFCVATITHTRHQDKAAIAFEERWITIHGPPVNVGFDPEFDNSDFGAMLDRHGIKATPRSALNRNKTGSVEAGNATLRIIATRILRDSKHLRDTKGITFTQQEIFARATLACNVLQANKKLCPLELAKGYNISFCQFEILCLQLQALLKLLSNQRWQMPMWSKSQEELLKRYSMDVYRAP